MPAINDRIRVDLLNKECALWIALTSADPGSAVLKLCSDEANLMFPQMDIITLERGPSDLQQALKPPFHRFDSYKLHDVRTIAIDLMAGLVTYRIQASRGDQTYNATVSTTWSQGSDGEWQICCHQETLV